MLISRKIMTNAFGLRVISSLQLIQGIHLHAFFSTYTCPSQHIQKYKGSNIQATVNYRWLLSSIYACMQSGSSIFFETVMQKDRQSNWNHCKCLKFSYINALSRIAIKNNSINTYCSTYHSEHYSRLAKAED